MTFLEKLNKSKFHTHFICERYVVLDEHSLSNAFPSLSRYSKYEFLHKS